MTVTQATGAPPHIVNWKAIDWRKVHNDVRRLQVRIAEAAREKRRILNRVLSINRVAPGGLCMCLSQLSRTVLRGEGGREAPALPGTSDKLILDEFN